MEKKLKKLKADPRIGSRILEHPKQKGTLYLLELIRKAPKVYLFGGGHISLHLVPLVKMVGFDLTLIDDRRKFASPERFPQADEIHVMDFRNLSGEIKFEPESYVVIVTRGHLYDKQVLSQVLKNETAYVGMIGSRRKRELIYRELEKEGFARSRLARVHSPIGLDIGAETPEEIAVSIVAEMISIRSGIQDHILGNK